MNDSTASAPDSPIVTHTTGSFYIPSLDGIRGLAFMVVFLAHAGLGFIVPAGFGVTTFFFLSGYLITSLLRREFNATGAVRMRWFYYRRILRIFPPLYVYLLTVLALHMFGVLRGEVSVGAVAAQATFFTNYYVLAVEDPMLPGGSSVLWSLAVEEHFYLLFPLAFVLMSRRMSPRMQAGILLGVCLLTLVWRCVLVHQFGAVHDRTYLATDTRIDSILFGCVLGVWCNPYMDEPLKLGNLQRSVGYVLGVGLLLFSFLYRDESFRTTFRYTVQGLALLPLFYLAVVDAHRPWIRWLNWKPVRFFGTLTYSLYLVHWTVLVIFRDVFEGPSPWPGLIALPISVAYAWAVYLLVEKPCAKVRRRFHAEAGRSSPSSPA